MGELVVPGLTALIGAVVAFGVARVQARAAVEAERVKSSAGKTGEVGTTEADTLWAESASMRRELREEVTGLRAEMVAIRAEHVALQARQAVSEEELRVSREHNERCDAEVASLRATINMMTPRPEAG